MTEKRYQINDSNFIIEILDDGIPMHYSTIVNRLNEQHEENEKLKLHLHILERVVYMLDNEVARAMEEGFDVSEWYLNYLAKGDVE